MTLKHPFTLAVLVSFSLACVGGCANAAAAPAAPATTPPPAPTGDPFFTILIFESPDALSSRTDPQAADAYWSSYDAFAGALMQAGALRGGSALSERERVTVKGDGSVDNAVAGARLGGYFVIQAPDLAAAQALAQSAPPAALLVEVRPHRDNPHMAKR